MAKESLYAQVRAVHERKAREVHHRLLSKALASPTNGGADFAVVAAAPRAAKPSVPFTPAAPVPSRPIVQSTAPVVEPAPKPSVVPPPAQPPTRRSPVPSPPPASGPPPLRPAPTPSGRPIAPDTSGQPLVMDPAWLAPSSRVSPPAPPPAPPPAHPRPASPPSSEPYTSQWEVAAVTPAEPRPASRPARDPGYKADWELPDEGAAAAPSQVAPAPPAPTSKPRLLGRRERPAPPPRIALNRSEEDEVGFDGLELDPALSLGEKFYSYLSMAAAAVVVVVGAALMLGPTHA